MEKREITYLFISHDLKLVSSFCQRMGVIYKGKLVEEGKSYEVTNNPKSDYTRLLIESAL